LFQPSQHAIKK